MTIENDFLPFAAAGGANVISQSAYLALAALGPGFSSGLAASNQLNKVWRQSSIISAVLAQVMCNITGANAIDDGTTTTLIKNFQAAYMMADFGTDTGAANAYTVSFPSGLVSVQEGMMVRFSPAHSNTGASTLNVNGLGALAILTATNQALSGGEIVAGGEICVSLTGANEWIIQNLSTGYASTRTPPTNDSSTRIASTAFVNPGSSIAQPGYAKLSSGLIIQWGSVGAAGTGGTQAFPLAFPTACFAVTCATSTAGGGYLSADPSASSFNWALGGSSSSAFHWIAVGH